MRLLSLFFSIFLFIQTSCSRAQAPPAQVNLSACEQLQALWQADSTTTALDFYQITTEQLLIQQKDTTVYWQLYHCYLDSQLDLGAVAQHEINFIHHYQLARYGIINEQESLAELHMDSAYQLNPQHLPLRELIHDHIFQQAQHLLAADDINELGKLLRQAASDYPFFLADENFRELLVFTKTKPK